MRHRAWHRGLMLLEDEASKIPAFTNNSTLLQVLQPAPTNMQLVCGKILVLLSFWNFKQFASFSAIYNFFFNLDNAE